MLLFGHVGITVGLVHVANRGADLRKAALVSILPDFIDKPLGLLYPKFFGNNTRLYGHSLLFSALLLAFFLWRRDKARTPFILWAACLGHLLFDKMWEGNLPSLFWPFLGDFPPLALSAFQRWKVILMDPYTYTGEILGIGVLLFLTAHYQLYRKDEARKFWRTGRLS